ncbi:MAG: PIG-L deacetylase family protein [Chloroflexota bacterium]
MPKSVLVFAPHPDDAEFFAGGTIAKMASDGARITLVVASDGGCGSFDHDRPTLIGLRRQEQLRAAAVLGVAETVFLGHPDLGLDTLAAGVLREQFIREIRRLKPEAMIAEDPFAPYEVHPDHRAVAWAASDAVHFASLPLMHPEHFEQGLEPHYVIEKYLYSEHLPSTNKVIDITSTIEHKLAAMAEHKSQLAFLVQDVVRQAALAGLDLTSRLGEAAGDPAAAMAWALRSQAAQAGARIGVEYGEAFRFVRFHPIVESLLDGS